LPNFGDKNADGNDLSGNANTINGDLNSIKHYIGELFFLRACEYFKRYQLFGDFPIITHPLLDDKEALSEASKRSPRNEVARFILSDLDKAITLLKAKNMPTTRINADAAILLKSRVALFDCPLLHHLCRCHMYFLFREREEYQSTNYLQRLEYGLPL
jgi:starch-binding outer membrane protein, SusD/RagB family